MKRRGQNSLEFLVLLGFMTVVFLGFFFAIESRITEQSRVNREAQYVQLADLFEKEVLQASKVKAGYVRAFTLPETLNNELYNFSLEDQDTLVIKGLETNEYIRFLAVNVTIVNPEIVCSDESDDILCRQNKRVVLQKNESGLYLMKRCAVYECGIDPCGLDAGDCGFETDCIDGACEARDCGACVLDDQRCLQIGTDSFTQSCELFGECYRWGDVLQRCGLPIENPVGDTCYYAASCIDGACDYEPDSTKGCSLSTCNPLTGWDDTRCTQMVCVDSDGSGTAPAGQLTNVAGNVSFASFFAQDSCDGNSVVEWYCPSSTVAPLNVTVACPLLPSSSTLCYYGNGCASDGVSANCTYGVEVKPTETFYANWSNNSCNYGCTWLCNTALGWTAQCTSSALRPCDGASCTATGWNISRCCIDTDPINNISIKGNVTFNGSVYRDDCISTSVLNQSWCHGPYGPVNSTTFDCTTLAALSSEVDRATCSLASDNCLCESWDAQDHAYYPTRCPSISCPPGYCGDSGAGGLCTCAPGQICNTSSSTCCSPTCGTACNVPDGCGGTCGCEPLIEVCEDHVCVPWEFDDPCLLNPNLPACQIGIN